MKTGFVICVLMAVIACTFAADDSNDRKYMQKEEILKRQLERLSELQAMEVFGTRATVDLAGVLDIINSLLDILTQLEAALPTPPPSTGTTLPC